MKELEELSIFADDPKYDEDNPNEGYFSWYACDYCNERLGGQRYDIVGLNAGDSTDDWCELSVCEECYCDLCG
ncbi:MAG: hypothetical protein ACYS5F_15690 [Planctomycetota bacterium]|jgi:hypothetical protein